jgi:long-chain acyl-CoA synthetase
VDDTGPAVLRAREDILEAEAGRTLIDAFMATCADHGDEPALVIQEGDGFRTRTWSDYRREASQVAMALRRRGIERGHFVALMMTNRPEHVISDVGVLLAGATPVSLYNTLAPDQIRYITDNCGAKVAIVEDAALLERWLAIREQLPDLDLIVVLDPTGVDLEDEHVVTYADLVASGGAALADGRAELERTWRSIQPDDALTLVYTSGTTGPPKGVVITHRGLLYQLIVISRTLNIRSGMRGVSYLPLAHIAERMMTHYSGIRYAATTYFVQDLTAVAATLAEARPHTFLGVPRVWEKMQAAILAKVHAEENDRKRQLALKAIEVGMAKVRAEMRGQRAPLLLRLQHAVFDRLVFSRVREGLGMDQLESAVTGAAPIDPDVLVFFAALGIEIAEVYGMTETTAVISFNRPGRIRFGTVGQPLPGLEVRLAEDGELLARGPVLTPGYHRREDATREAIDADGWLHTGDLAVVDDEGYYRIVGRKKEMIITAGGKNLAPTNVEATIKQRSPIIGQLCAVGDRQPFVAALVVLDAETLPGWCEARGVPFRSLAEAAEHPTVIAEVQRAIDEGNAELARVEQVRQWAIVPSEWTAESEELTPTMKLKRNVIQAKYSDVIDRMYASTP